MIEGLLRRRSSEACLAMATGETSVERPRGYMSKGKGVRGDVRGSKANKGMSGYWIG